MSKEQQILDGKVLLITNRVLSKYMNKPWQWMTQDKRESTKPNSKWWIMPTWRLNHIVFCYDVYYGHVIIINLQDETLFTGKDGIFEATWCALGDYYGFPDGAYFEKRNP